MLAYPGMIHRDGSQHEYTKLSLENLLAIPRKKLDTGLPKEVIPTSYYGPDSSSSTFGTQSHGSLLKNLGVRPRIKFASMYDDSIVDGEIDASFMALSSLNRSKKGGS